MTALGISWRIIDSKFARNFAECKRLAPSVDSVATLHILLSRSRYLENHYRHRRNQVKYQKSRSGFVRDFVSTKSSRLPLKILPKLRQRHRIKTTRCFLKILVRTDSDLVSAVEPHSMMPPIPMSFPIPMMKTLLLLCKSMIWKQKMTKLMVA